MRLEEKNKELLKLVIISVDELEQKKIDFFLSSGMYFVTSSVLGDGINAYEIGNYDIAIIDSSSQELAIKLSNEIRSAELHNKKSNGQTSIIILVPQFCKSKIELAKNLGIDAIVIKPVNWDELPALINRL